MLKRVTVVAAVQWPRELIESYVNSIGSCVRRKAAPTATARGGITIDTAVRGLSLCKDVLPVQLSVYVCGSSTRRKCGI